MRSLFLSLSFFASALSFAANAAAQTPVSPALVDAVIEKLQKSGALDQAVERSLRNLAEREKQSQMKAQQDQAQLARRVSAQRDHIYGNPDAPWSYIVYSDLECPYCKRSAGAPEQAAKSIGLNTVNVVFRHFPLDFHGVAARKEAAASECVAEQAGSEGFFKFINLVFAHTQLNGKGLPNGDDDLVSLAVQSGAKDSPKFSACMQAGTVMRRVREDFEDGARAGVTGTPGNIIRNNKTGRSVPAHGSLPGGAAAVEKQIRDIINGRAQP